MTEELLNTKEVARYLGIHEKQVYALVKAGRLPGSRLTGKWVFPRRLLDEWLEKDARAGLAQAREKSRQVGAGLLAAGSNDPLLDLLLGQFHQAHPESFIFSATTGSTAGLRALRAGHTDLAWSHLLDPESGDYNFPWLARHPLPGQPVVVNLFRRRLGWLAAANNPLGIQGAGDLARPGVRLVNRQGGAGTRVLLDLLLAEAGVEGSAVAGYGREVCTHLEVGLAVLAGEADTGLATGGVALQLGLHFLPVTDERFDLVLLQETYFQRPVQDLLAVLRADSFRTAAAGFWGYDLADAGRIMYPKNPNRGESS
ncbi:MAG: helix-turn-helix transcriptional regulator [Thermodesulfobacteriota bacterium]